MEECGVRVVVIGSGSVASVLAPAIDSADGMEVAQVYSPTLTHAENLARRMANSTATDCIENIMSDADIYLISVKDDAIAPLVEHLAPNDALWVHTSGGVEAETLAPLSPHYGVLYPMQTFTKGVELDVRRIPMFVEGSTPQAFDKVHRLALQLSDTVRPADSERRRRLHAAAVFACNFANHLWTRAADILATDHLDFSILEPLVSETLRKALDIGPAKGQTGPARRDDQSVMARHLPLLTSEQANLYKVLSSSITKYYHEFNQLRPQQDTRSGV